MPNETAFNLAVILISWCPQHPNIFLLWGTFFTLGSKKVLAHAKSDKYGGWLIRTMLPWSIHSPLPCAPLAEMWGCREQTFYRSSSFLDKQFQELCCFWCLFSEFETNLASRSITTKNNTTYTWGCNAWTNSARTSSCYNWFMCQAKTGQSTNPRTLLFDHT